MAKETVVDVPEASEVVEPEVVEAEEKKELAKVEGRTFGILKDALSSFAPELREDMPIEERREAVRKVLKDSKSLDDKVYLVRAELLYELQQNEYWKSYTFQDPDTGEVRPYSNFKEYTKEELNIGGRTAMYLCDIYRKCVVDLKLPTEALKDLEWSKVKEVVKQLTADNYTDIFDKLSNMSLKEAIEYGREIDPKRAAKGTKTKEPKEPGEKTAKLTFNLAPEQYENVTKALQIAGSFTGSESQEHQLDLICSDFRASSIGAEDPEGALTKLEVLLANIRRTYNVEVEVVGMTGEAAVLTTDEEEEEDED